MFQLRGLSSRLAFSFFLQPGALGGKCYLLGTLVIQQLREPSGSTCEVSGSPPSYFFVCVCFLPRLTLYLCIYFIEVE